MKQNNNINYNMEELNKLIADPIFIDFLNGIEYNGFVFTFGGYKFIIIMN